MVCLQQNDESLNHFELMDVIKLGSGTKGKPPKVVRSDWGTIERVSRPGAMDHGQTDDPVLETAAPIKTLLQKQKSLHHVQPNNEHKQTIQTIAVSNQTRIARIGNKHLRRFRCHIDEIFALTMFFFWNVVCIVLESYHYICVSKKELNFLAQFSWKRFCNIIIIWFTPSNGSGQRLMIGINSIFHLFCQCCSCLPPVFVSSKRSE